MAVRLDFGRVVLPAGAYRGDEWGCAVEYDASARTDRKDRVLAALCKGARNTLPPATRYEVREDLLRPPGALHAMAWYRDERVPSPDNTDAYPEREPGPSPDGSYLLVGQYRTPAAGAVEDRRNQPKQEQE